MRDYKTCSIIFALKREYKGFIDGLQEKVKEKVTLLKEKPFFCSKLVIQDKEIIFALSGLGKARAAACTQHVIDAYNPYIIINAGSAGGVCPNVKKGGTYFISTVVEYDFKSIREKTPILSTDSRLIHMAQKLDIPLAVLGSADQNADTKEKKEGLHKLGIMIADWECAAIFKTCQMNGKTAVAFKAVTDTSHSDFVKEFTHNVFPFSKNLSKTIFKFLDAMGNI